MRAIDSAVSLAQDIESEVRLIWNVDSDVGAPVKNLFTEISGINQIKIYRRSGLAHTIRKTLGLRQRKTILTQPVIRAMTEANFDFRSLRDATDLHLWTYDAFYPSTVNFKIFKTQDSILDEARQTTRLFNNTIGVHIRRADNVVAIARSPEDLFVERMQDEIDKDKNVSFFITSDDPFVEQRMNEHFPGRIITRTKATLARSRQEGIRQALIDVHCLAGCKRIFGCTNSSFSPVAASIGNVPIEIIQR